MDRPRKPRHTIPTHLNVEDTFLWGMSNRQVMCLVAGAASTYGTWEQLWWASTAVQWSAALAVAALALALTFTRHAGRSLDQYAFVVLHYRLLPRRSTWSVSERGLEGEPCVTPARTSYRHELAWGRVGRTGGQHGAEL